ncbi:uncharacterized protein OCT59_010300 [Rhizophagus irregularis]|uniref:uncharacterized protein n=1 Tax=Rhizophagus irregularis TaxID=588596 RepID=UPI003325B397|nr:hypothetical protein OCT59_010300 [Rhizophagus irregularis]
MVNNLNYDSTRPNVEVLQNEMIRQYAVARRIQPIETDQMSTVGQSETSSQSRSKGQVRLEVLRNKLNYLDPIQQLFDQIKEEKDLIWKRCAFMSQWKSVNLEGKSKRIRFKGFMREISRRKMITLVHNR